MKNILLILLLLCPLCVSAKMPDSLRVEKAMQKKFERLKQRDIQWRKYASNPNVIAAGVAVVGRANPTFSLEYSRHVASIWQVGATFSYSRMVEVDSPPSSYGRCVLPPPVLPARHIKDVATTNIYGMSVFARINWFERKYVTMYSSFGMSLTYRTENEDSYYDNGSVFETRTADFIGGNVPLLPELIPFGVRFGGRFFGFFEPFGFSNRGFAMTFGAGYRF